MNALEYIDQTYDVAIDMSRFRAEAEDSSVASPMILFRVGLTGRHDLRWQKAFCFTQWDAIENFFYRISEDGDTVCFLSPRDEAAANVKLRLRALASFLGMVNANANRKLSAHQDWSESAADVRNAMSA